MKQTILNMFDAKKIKLGIDADNLIHDVTLDRIGGTYDTTLEIEGAQDEEERIEVNITFNYFHGQLIDVTLNGLTYHVNDEEHHYYNDLLIDIAFNKFLNPIL